MNNEYLPGNERLTLLLDRVNVMERELSVKLEKIKLNYARIKHMEALSTTNLYTLEDSKLKFAQEVSSLWSSIHAFDDLVEFLLTSDFELTDIVKEYLINLQQASNNLIKFASSIS